MRTVNYSHARNNLKTLIEDVCDNDETYIITNKNAKTVMMSLEKYSRKQTQIKEDIKISLEILNTANITTKTKPFKGLNVPMILNNK